MNHIMEGQKPKASALDNPAIRENPTKPHKKY